MNKNVVILILGILICYKCGYSQNRIEVYKFVAEKVFFSDSITGFYLDAMYEFSYKRVYMGDSTFSEIGLFPTNDSTFFYIKNGNWYIKYKKKWLLFYSSTGKKVKPKIRIANIVFNLINIGSSKINDIECIIYRLVVAQKNTSVSLYEDYWFNPAFGIVKIKTSDTSLIREDLKP